MGATDAVRDVSRDAPTDWRREAIWLSILYRITECGDTLPIAPETDVDRDREAFCGDEILAMRGLGYLDLSQDKTHYVASEKGRELVRALVGMCLQTRVFEVFGSVDIRFTLTDAHGRAWSDGSVDNAFDNVYDPRFLAYDDLGREIERPEGRTEHVEDLRLAMVDWYAWKNRARMPDGVSLHRIVIIQKLADGEFRSDRFWFDLKHTHLDAIEEIVRNAYQWRSLGNDAEEAAIVAQQIYTAGMVESRKRRSSECRACGTPLGMYEAQLHAGEALTECPNPECRKQFDDDGEAGESSGGEECPQCGHAITFTDRHCAGCGADVDRSLAAGSVETTTTPVVCDPWSHDPVYYGYAPVYYYDPWDPFADALVFGIVCAVLW